MIRTALIALALCAMIVPAEAHGRRHHHHPKPPVVVVPPVVVPPIVVPPVVTPPVVVAPVAPVVVTHEPFCTHELRDLSDAWQSVMCL
jgi:hypothetical protein